MYGKYRETGNTTLQKMTIMTSGLEFLGTDYQRLVLYHFTILSAKLVKWLSEARMTLKIIATHPFI
jgi:hypothetical protein